MSDKNDVLGDLRVENGLTLFGPDMIELVRLLDGVVTGWAGRWNAPEYMFPELIKVDDLRRIDYFDNFPHLAFCATALKVDAQATLPRQGSSHLFRTLRGSGGKATGLIGDNLADAAYALQSAACYNLYFALKEARLSGSMYVTMVGRCFRREQHFEGLDRLLSFRQREIVCVGASNDVNEHLERCRLAFTKFSEALGLGLQVNQATDPFFAEDSSRARMQRLFPTKREFVYDQRLAIASLNAHRNFFGERCEIRLSDGEFAFSGCFGVGLERLSGALIDKTGSVEAALARVRDAIAEGAGVPPNP